MMYTVRYREIGDGQRSERVEANGPSEAMIKFRAFHPGFSKGPRQQVVTSVCHEIPVDESSDDDDACPAGNQ